jgi:diguanylate cyclase (GGDEF)-like protein
MPGTPLEEAVAEAELLRQELLAAAIRNLGSERGILTASLGVASGIARADRSPGTLVSAADLALYRAKSAGRDRVEREAIE